MYYVRNNRNILFLLVDTIAVLLALAINVVLYYEIFYDKLGILPITSVTVIFLTIIVHSYENVMYRKPLVELRAVIYTAIKAILVFVFMYSQIFKGVVRTQIIIKIFVLTVILMYTFRMLGKFYFSKLRNVKKHVIIISSINEIENILSNLNKEEEVIGIVTKQKVGSYKDIPVVNELNDITCFLSTNYVDEVFINIGEFGLDEIIRWTDIIGLTANINLTPLLNNFSGHYLFTRQNQNIYLTSSLNIARLYQVMIKRIMDIFFGLIGLVLMGVALLFVYPIVMKQSPGPIFFKQKRIGKNGKVFNMYKFRSMYLDAEERKQELMQKNELNTDLMFKIKDDPRIFPFGKIMRKLSIDELPQFINVLLGEMSLVGTRPPTLDEWNKYESHHFKRLFIKPGITGLWQVSGRSDIKDFEEVVKLDLEYIRNWRILLDVKIILKTIKVVLKKEGSS